MGGGNLARQSRRKGFTLLEVLAVIVVLAVIAVITIPIVTGVMNDAKRNSFKTSADNLVKAANNYYADNQLSIDSVMTFCFGLTGSNCTSEKLKFSGKKPTQGKLIINPDGEVSLIDISNGTYYANYDSSVDDDIVITEDNEVLTRDELTQAIKDLKKKLENNEKELLNTKNALQTEIAKKSNKTDLDKVQTQLNSTTTIANTANNTANSLNSTRLNKTYPVGSIYINYSSTNPASLFGGTWVAFGTGRTLVGIDTSNGNFNSLGKTGGSSSQSIKLTTANLPSHTHTFSGRTSEGLSISTMRIVNAGGSGSAVNHVTGFDGTNGYHDVGANNGFPASSHYHNFSGTTGATGSATAFSVNTQNPYITVYMWRRTA